MVKTFLHSFLAVDQRNVSMTSVSCVAQWGVFPDLRMAQIPEQPQLERPKTTPGTGTPGTVREGAQNLNTRGFKSMKTAGTVKFQGSSGSGPLGAP